MSAFQSEIEPDKPLTPFERVSLGALGLWLLCALLFFVSTGCVNENTGTSTIVGEQLALPEITDSSDNVAVRVYESIKGARVWTAKDSLVTIEYSNSYTNSYFGIVDTRDSMRLKVKVEPCVSGSAEAASGSAEAAPSVGSAASAPSDANRE